jgi:hypothetical protein
MEGSIYVKSKHKMPLSLGRGYVPKNTKGKIVDVQMKSYAGVTHVVFLVEFEDSDKRSIYCSPKDLTWL